MEVHCVNIILPNTLSQNININRYKEFNQWTLNFISSKASNPLKY